MYVSMILLFIKKTKFLLIAAWKVMKSLMDMEFYRVNMWVFYCSYYSKSKYQFPLYKVAFLVFSSGLNLAAFLYRMGLNIDSTYFKNCGIVCCMDSPEWKPYSSKENEWNSDFCLHSNKQKKSMVIYTNLYIFHRPWKHHHNFSMYTFHWFYFIDIYHLL